MSDPSIPIDPTQPRDPVLVPYRRPAPVTLAALLMSVGAALGLISAITLFTGAGNVADGFRHNAQSIDATADDINTVTTLIRTVFVGAGLVTVALAVALGILTFGVLKGRNGARIAALVFVGLSLCCGLGSSSYTVLGRNADWTINLDNASEQMASEIGQAYTDAMPGVLVGATGGLTDLQSLGYIAVAVLLLVPVSHAYFRRRANAPVPAAPLPQSALPPPPATPSAPLAPPPPPPAPLPAPPGDGSGRGPTL